MVLDLVITKTDDGFNAEIPSISGCETWAHKEDDVIDSALDLAMFYLNLEDKKDINVDRARRSGNRTIYKLVFDKK